MQSISVEFEWYDLPIPMLSCSLPQLQIFCSLDSILHDGAEIALLPPVSGG